MRKLGKSSNEHETEKLTERQWRQDAERPEPHQFKIERFLDEPIALEYAPPNPGSDKELYAPSADLAEIASKSISVQARHWRAEAQKALEERNNGRTGGYPTSTSGSATANKHTDASRDSQPIPAQVYKDFLTKNANWGNKRLGSDKTMNADAVRKSMEEENIRRLRNANNEIKPKRKLEIDVEQASSKRIAGTVVFQERQIDQSAETSDKAKSPTLQIAVDRPRVRDVNER